MTNESKISQTRTSNAINEISKTQLIGNIITTYDDKIISRVRPQFSFDDKIFLLKWLTKLSKL